MVAMCNLPIFDEMCWFSKCPDFLTNLFVRESEATHRHECVSNQKPTVNAGVGQEVVST
jgi:hypothetical protein